MPFVDYVYISVELSRLIFRTWFDKVFKSINQMLATPLALSSQVQVSKKLKITLLIHLASQELIFPTIKFAALTVYTNT